MTDREQSPFSIEQMTFLEYINVTRKIRDAQRKAALTEPKQGEDVLPKAMTE